MIDTPPDARACACPAPDDDGHGAPDVEPVEHCAREACPACSVLAAQDPCWALIIATIADECETEVHEGGDILVVHGGYGQRRLTIYSPSKRLWVTFPPPPSLREPVPALDHEHPRTLDDARWIAASWLATLPRTDRTEGMPT